MPNISVKHNGENCDISRFLQFHPGGSNTLNAFKGCEISEQLKKTNHAPSAYKLLKDLKESKEDEEDLEKLVDWNKPMLWQVGSLGDRYNEWVLSPVDRKMRIFQNDILETMTVTPWFLVPSVWIPVCTALIYTGYKRLETHSQTTFFMIGIAIIIGYFIWPFIEYSIHRWIFHMNPRLDSPMLITLHFLLHGLHHKVPFDDGRLLFPPAAAAIVITFFYSIFRLILPSWIVPPLVAGGILGYVTYDLIHFYSHYGSPDEGSYLYYMKRYHNQHHFTNHNVGYGISSPVWDHVFGTLIKLKNTKYKMKWYKFKN